MKEIWTRWVEVRFGRNGSGRIIFMVEFRPYPKGAMRRAQFAPMDSGYWDTELHLTDKAEPYYLPRNR